jgi:hypothetical protein
MTSYISCGKTWHLPMLIEEYEVMESLLFVFSYYQPQNQVYFFIIKATRIQTIGDCIYFLLLLKSESYYINPTLPCLKPSFGFSSQ